MLRMAHGEDEIEIRFYHEIYEPYEIEGITGINVDEARRCTRAIIRLTSCTKNGDNTHTSHGTSICHPEDNFCRKIGRKRALQEALFSLSRQLGMYGKNNDGIGMKPQQLKKLRTAIWNEYITRCHI